jgi:methyl-accepting chemotaxis protein
VLVFGLFATITASGSLESLAPHQSTEMAKSLANMTDLAVREELKIVSQLSHLEIIVDAAAEHAKGSGSTSIGKASETLARLVKDSGDVYEVIFIAGVDGKVFADGVDGGYKGIDLSERDYLKTALSGKINIGSVVKSKMSGLPMLTFGAPVYSKSNELVGVVGLAPKIYFLTEKIDAIKLRKTGFASVINKDGVLISPPQKEYILSFDLHDRKA